MAEADFTAFTAATNNGLDAGDVSKGVTQAFTPPNGGGLFTHGFHSLSTAGGFAGYYYSGLPAFNPITPQKCGSIRGALQRQAPGSGYAPMLAFMSGTDLTTNKGYILGLSDSDPYQIVLRKGLLIGGLDPTTADVLRVSDESFNSNTLWIHLRIDVIVNPQGDVVINIFRNDLTVNTVTAPIWVTIPGMDPFTDDGNGILTGELPLTSGFRGVFGHFNDALIGKVSLFDHIEIFRQISP